MLAQSFIPDHGDAALIQKILQKTGHYFGEVTGIFDQQTRQALLSFQVEQKIPTTGIMDKKTCKSLKWLSSKF